MGKTDGLIIPRHIAMIMDGNGRWAKKRMMPRSYGHQAGGRVLERICEDAYDLGVKYITVYAFSTENWTRSKDEVDTLMKILRDYLKDCVKKARKNNMKVSIIGDITRLEPDIQEKIRILENETKDFDGLNLQIALNYGGRDELLRASKKMAEAYKEGRISLDEIKEADFEQFLDTRGIPEPDLLIRTSGEKRISNFMLWQLAYTEFYFPDTLWPDFNKDGLIKAIEYYNQVDRRYGNV